MNAMKVFVFVIVAVATSARLKKRAMTSAMGRSRESNATRGCNELVDQVFGDDTGVVAHYKQACSANTTSIMHTLNIFLTFQQSVQEVFAELNDNAETDDKKLAKVNAMMELYVKGNREVDKACFLLNEDCKGWRPIPSNKKAGIIKVVYKMLMLGFGVVDGPRKKAVIVVPYRGIYPLHPKSKAQVYPGSAADAQAAKESVKAGVFDDPYVTRVQIMLAEMVRQTLLKKKIDTTYVPYPVREELEKMGLKTDRSGKIKSWAKSKNTVVTNANGKTIKASAIKKNKKSISYVTNGASKSLLTTAFDKNCAEVVFAALYGNAKWDDFIFIGTCQHVAKPRPWGHAGGEAGDQAVASNKLCQWHACSMCAARMDTQPNFRKWKALWNGNQDLYGYALKDLVDKSNAKEAQHMKNAHGAYENMNHVFCERGAYRGVKALVQAANLPRPCQR